MTENPFKLRSWSSHAADSANKKAKHLENLERLKAKNGYNGPEAPKSTEAADRSDMSNQGRKPGTRLFGLRRRVGRRKASAGGHDSPQADYLMKSLSEDAMAPKDDPDERKESPSANFGRENHGQLLSQQKNGLEPSGRQRPPRLSRGAGFSKHYNTQIKSGVGNSRFSRVSAETADSEELYEEELPTPLKRW